MIALGPIGIPNRRRAGRAVQNQRRRQVGVEVDGDFAWETVLSVTGKGAESKFVALGARKGGTAAAGGREGSQ